MTPEDKELFKTILERENQKELTHEQAKTMLGIYANCFHSKIDPCDTCGGVYKSILNKLTKLYHYED